MTGTVTITARLLELVIFRVEHDSIHHGHYLSRPAARAHAEDFVRRETIPDGARSLWVPDHGGDDAEEELVLFGPGPDDEVPTGYRVVPITVDDHYDPNADE